MTVATNIRLEKSANFFKLYQAQLGGNNKMKGKTFELFNYACTLRVKLQHQILTYIIIILILFLYWREDVVTVGVFTW